MRIERQQYKDSTYENALVQGCDSFQLKLDGWWVRIEIKGGVATVYSRTNRELKDHSFVINGDVNAVLVGELMFGTNWSQDSSRKGKIFLFDMWKSDELDTEGLPYKTRYSLLKTVMPFLPPHFQRVPNFPITEWPSIWKMFVTDGAYEGVVFRKKTDPVNATLLRQKNTIEDEYTVLGYTPGEGKYSDTLGAIIVGDKAGKPMLTGDGSPASVGGGFDDADRDTIWAARPDFLGRRFKVEGKYRFPESGLLRHPNFTGWVSV